MSSMPSASSERPPSLRSALKTDDERDRTPPASGSLKAVQIAEPEIDNQSEDEHHRLKQFSAGISRRLGGKLPPSHMPGASSRSSLVSEASGSNRLAEDPSPSLSQPQSQSHSHRHRRQYYSEKLLAQVSDWLEREKKKAAGKKKRPHRRKSNSPPVADEAQEAPPNGIRGRADSIDSQSSHVSLDRLQRILEDSMSSFGLESLPPFSPRMGGSRRGHRKTGSRASLHRTASSDTDYVDGDAIVPSCDAWLDNSKTLSYTGGGAATDDVTALSSRADKEKEAWLVFKNETIRIAHTLRLKGWRRIPLDGGDTITIERLSGALTNAVYVVTPPKDLPEADGKKNPTTKVLLRVYGPQVEHLIDRENELMVLQRLARKKIGPRLLGTFKNGRFEQFFNAITLTPADLREHETSRSIAKRMRELHDGIELLPHEREGGPGVWKNWDSWNDNVARIITFLDKQVESNLQSVRRDSVIHAWKANGYVCGTPWTQFQAMVTKYKSYLCTFYKGPKDINDRMTFAHNDTQYGNILRIVPDDEKSPLLQAANKHKQLVVIDFEYAAANTPGLEFANHFTEWTYNYHDPVSSHACNTRRYPTIEEQRRFLKAYVDHRPQFPHASSTPRLTPLDGNASYNTTPPVGPASSASSIVDFMLDARVPPGGWSAAERARDEQSDHQVRELLDETRLWRPANSAMWVAWGIIQAKVPGLEADASALLGDGALEAEDEDGVDEFDYLSYAQDRALFFWGDCVQMGLVKAEDLPETLRSRLKIVDY